MPIIESYAAIIALIGQFKAERGAMEQAGFNEFMEWLVKSNHQEMKSLLELNAKATIGIKAILNQDREKVFEYLERIDNAIASFASNFDGFNDLAAAIKPNAALSDQAISILRQFEESGASRALELRTFDGSEYIFLDISGQITIEDHRFAHDDFNTLIDLGLLRHEYNNKGDNLYLYTRLASSLIARLGS